MKRTAARGAGALDEPAVLRVGRGAARPGLEAAGGGARVDEVELKGPEGLRGLEQLRVAPRVAVQRLAELPAVGWWGLGVGGWGWWVGWMGEARQAMHRQTATADVPSQNTWMKGMVSALSETASDTTFKLSSGAAAAVLAVDAGGRRCRRRRARSLCWGWMGV